MSKNISPMKNQKSKSVLTEREETQYKREEKRKANKLAKKSRQNAKKHKHDFETKLKAQRG